MKITSARIAYGKDRWSTPEVFVTIDGKESRLFEYYADELSFKSSEFIGLTREEALDLRYKKDLAYIRS